MPRIRSLLAMLLVVVHAFWLGPATAATLQEMIDAAPDASVFIDAIDVGTPLDLP